MKWFSVFVIGWCGLISESAAGPSVTIYNQNFGVVRESVPLELKQGENQIRFSNASGQLEPDSVILRDPSGKVSISVLEQNYRADPVTSGLLLSLNEGKEIEFIEKREGQEDRIVRGKVIRSGYQSYSTEKERMLASYGIRYNPKADMLQPIIEVEGKLRFSLPGEPVFPSLADDSILKPTLEWRLHSDQESEVEAELSYVTKGLSWEADYNVVAPEKGEQVDFTGWITMDNQCGKTFPDATVQLIAGDVAKLNDDSDGFGFRAAADPFADAPAPAVSQKSFDEFHLYTLPLATTLRDRETKQVEFSKASGVASRRLYVYDGAFIDPQRWRGRSMSQIRHDENYGTESNPKVWVMREIDNTKANGLGIPLPRGKVRFYRRDDEGKLQFVGEDRIDHTPRDEMIRLYTGNSFDLVGERKRTNFTRGKSEVTESFEIRVRNRKENDAVEIRVVEHLYRWTNWEIKDPSMEYRKNDSQTIEFRVPLKAGEEKVINYTVRYWW